VFSSEVDAGSREENTKKPFNEKKAFRREIRKATRRHEGGEGSGDGALRALSKQTETRDRSQNAPVGRSNRKNTLAIPA
jgi:hypothetical protein